MPLPENAKTGSRVSAARLALAVRRLREEKENLDLIASDPIAIVGMGCRFPGGAASPEEFWTALREGRDCVRDIPNGRWADAALLPPGMRRGGYIEEIEGFDAGYFGISPREAREMDPQQRLLLEVAWEALWDAGVEPGSLGGANLDSANLGVFVAIYNSDYSRLHFRDMSNATAHTGVGAAHSVAAGRLSFLLNARGPSLAVDSACSSSLVAAHLACQSLRARECDAAIVAASSLKLLSDEVQVFAKWGMLASDGKCKTFDAGADGFVPGEGCGVLLLKRLSDALQDGDRVRAVIRGTAVNHDGRTTVLTAPNGLAQEAVLRAALKNAMLEPGEVSYIETHGTGTALGDPIEMEAIRNVYGAAGMDVPPCVLGAVKTNLGHLEASAGMAGLIKAVLCLEQGEIPRNLHFTTLNPEISLAGSRFRIPVENVPWAGGERPRVAGVSSFGLGGTNGHVLLEEAPVVPVRAKPIPARRWERQRFPIAPPLRTTAVTAGAEDFVHPLLGRRVDSPFVEGALFASELNLAAQSYLAEHRLGDRVLVPFAAFLEMAAAAVRQVEGASGIRNFAMSEPCFVSGEGCRVQALVSRDAVEIASESGSGWKTNARGMFSTVEAEAERIDLAAVRERCEREISIEEMYRELERTGLRYGAPFRVMQSAQAGDGESLAHLRLPEELRGEAARYGVHPVLLDGCLQTVAVARQGNEGELFLPIGVDAFELRRTGAAEVWVHTRIVSSTEEAVSVDVTIADESGAVVARLSGFTAKRTNARRAELMGRGDEGLSYELVWSESAREPVTADRRGERWLLVETGERDSNALADWLRQRGAACERVSAARFRGADFVDRLWTGVVFDVRGIRRQASARWEHPEKSAVDFLLELVRLLAAVEGAVPRLWMVVSSAVAVLPGEDVSVEQGMLLGMVRTLALEYPETRAAWIDVGASTAETAKRLAEEMAGESEAIVAFRNGVRYRARLVHRDAGNERPRRLQLASSGRLEDLRLEAAGRIAPGPHEIEIQVRAAGLNFRDVLTALGMLPARLPVPGGECAGTIVGVGAEVEDWRVGDDVVAFAPGSLRSSVNVPVAFAVRKPAAMTFVEAAGIPIVFLTAHYGLDRLAKLAAGQTVLIHAAAGGLGLAAVQLAMRAGATVLATAGSAEKQAYLHKLGVEHVFDSRSLRFREEVLAATGGSGVDVVLNSLSGDLLSASFDVVARGGCFLEVGKRGIWSAAEVAAIGKDIRYFPFDLGEVAMEDPSQIAVMLGELMSRFSAGELRALPTALYRLENSIDAFRTMAQARHIGKIVLGVGNGEPEANLRELISEGTVLITGGLGALGVETARWLAAEGARSLVLAGRKTRVDEAYPVVEELRSRGIEVAVEHVDVASADSVRELLERIHAARLPLRAVFHAAGVARDAVLANETWNSYSEATKTKIEGAWNLHRLTGDDLPLMVFYSSATSILGSAGQGSYAAGNAFLDALAQHRASRGLRTLSVNWGTWGDGGMAARLSPEMAARAKRLGMRPMQAGAALAALQLAIEAGRTQVAIADIDWERFVAGRRDAALFAELTRVESRGQAHVGKETGIRGRLDAAAPGERRKILSAHVKACARRVLGLELTATIAEDIPLQDLGLDSLMALEMRNELAQSLDLSLVAGLVFDYPSVEQLTEHLLGLLEKCSSALDALSEDEAERLLIEELDRAEKERANA